MQSTRTFKDRVFLVIKGLAMGAANKVPGVSGGVVSFVAGFYQEFIYSLQRINKTAFKLLFNGRFKSFYRYINGKFLSLLFLGMIVSYFSVSKILDYLIAHYELFVWSTFFGMILGSIYYFSKDFGEWNRKTITALIIGAMIGTFAGMLIFAYSGKYLLIENKIDLSKYLNPVFTTLFLVLATIQIIKLYLKRKKSIT